MRVATYKTFEGQNFRGFREHSQFHQLVLVALWLASTEQPQTFGLFLVKFKPEYLCMQCMYVAIWL